MTKNCPALRRMHSLARHFFLIISAVLSLPAVLSRKVTNVCCLSSLMIRPGERQTQVKDPTEAYLQNNGQR